MAYLVDLCYDGETPVVFIGAMRNPSLGGTDGPHNLLTVVRATTSDGAHGCGVLVYEEPIVAVHIISVESVSDPSETIVTDSDPPKSQSCSGGTKGYSGSVITLLYTRLSEGRFSEYVCLDDNGC